MIVMRHEFDLKGGTGPSRVVSTLIQYGDPNGFSAMALTVGLPAAIAARLVLTGAIRLTGVQIPTVPEIYEQVLPELETAGIVFQEEVF
jgi:saccharopine dehydrogenase (NADP+, L-glutamate forming)